MIRQTETTFYTMSTNEIVLTALAADTTVQALRQQFSPTVV